MTNLTCTRCKESKIREDFPPNCNRAKWCRKCNADWQRDFRARNPGYKGSGRNKGLQSLSNQEIALHRMMVSRRSDILQRQRRYGAPGTAPSAEELVSLYHRQEGKCALSGVQLSLEAGPDSISIDQIEAGAGYDLDNIQLLTWAVNRAKGDLSLGDFFKMCASIARRNDYLAREYSQVAGSAPHLEMGDDIV